MSRTLAQHVRPRTVVFAGLLGLVFASCSDNQGGLDAPGTGGKGGSSGQGTSGSSSGTTNGGTANGGTANGGEANGGEANGGQANGGEANGGEANGGEANGGEAGSVAAGGTGGGSAGTGGGPMGGSGGKATSCVYSDDVPEADGGASGAAGDTGVASGISVRTSVFGGQHLTDSEGRPLYVFGADVPGDCEQDPSVGCDTACQVNWTPFSDPATSLDAALNPNWFGSTVVMVGDPPTPGRVSTYYGWPLYYYVKDTLGTGSAPKWSTAGAGVARLWHLAKVRPPNVVIMRYRINPTTTALYLANGSGMTLYTYASDTIGESPSSACTGVCLDSYAPLLTNSISAVSSLDSSDLSLFVRPDEGTLQVAYKGAPLYVAAVDLHPGERLGVETDVWAIVAP